MSDQKSNAAAKAKDNDLDDLLDSEYGQFSGCLPHLII